MLRFETFTSVEPKRSVPEFPPAASGEGRFDLVAVVLIYALFRRRRACPLWPFEAPLFACARLGVCLQPVSWRLAAPEIAYQLEDAEPSLLLADEPTGNLDSVNSKIVCELLRDLSVIHNKTIIMVTHEPAVAAYATDVAVLKDGKLVERFATDEAKNLAIKYQELVGNK